jgi:hypothetical protein
MALLLTTGCAGAAGAAPAAHGVFTAEIAGTPTFVPGEGYVTMHAMRRTGGAWELAVVRGASLTPGTVHNVEARLVERRPPMADVGSQFVEVVREVSRARGGPPVRIVAGREVAGIDVTTLEGPRAEWGPFVVQRRAVSFAPFAVGGIEVGGRTLAPESSLEEVAAALPGCAEQPVRGGRFFRCPGVTIRSSGDTSLPENVEITIEGPGFEASDPSAPEQTSP